MMTKQFDSKAVSAKVFAAEKKVQAMVQTMMTKQFDSNEVSAEVFAAPFKEGTTNTTANLRSAESVPPVPLSKATIGTSRVSGGGRRTKRRRFRGTKKQNRHKGGAKKQTMRKRSKRVRKTRHK